MSMIDHFGLSVGDHARALAFYDTILAPLGYRRLQDFDLPHGRFTGYGDTKPDFWLSSGGRCTGRLHIAFSAASREAVDAFHRAALQAGARDNGAPGLREIYHPDYYGAFVFDPDGHNIEAVCHAPA